MFLKQIGRFSKILGILEYLPIATQHHTNNHESCCCAIILARLTCGASCYFQRQLELNGDMLGVDETSTHHNLTGEALSHRFGGRPSCQSQQVDNIRQLDGKSYHVCFRPAATVRWLK